MFDVKVAWIHNNAVGVRFTYRHMRRSLAALMAGNLKQNPTKDKKLLRLPWFVV